MKTHEMIEVMQAYEDGKAIQYSNKGEDAWRDVVYEPEWVWQVCDYRIKPEPKYVLYDNVSEVEKDKWLKGKSTGRLYRILRLDPSDNSVSLFGGWVTLKELFEDYAYEDGNPCGKKVEA